MTNNTFFGTCYIYNLPPMQSLTELGVACVCVRERQTDTETETET